MPPPICAPKALVISAASPQFSIESSLAIDEAVSILKFNKEFQYPQIAIPKSYHSTTSSRWQGIRKSLGLFYDKRSIQNAETYCTASPLGSLPLAVARAVGRANLEGGLNNPASVLEIGAGQRRVSAGIKAVFGEMVINSEIAPAYSMQSGIDRELPASGIDDAELGIGNFDLIFSIFGNLYGKDQLKILGKVVNGLKSGGEFFLMWKPTIGNLLLHRQIRRNREMLFRYGLALSSDILISSAMALPEILIIIWGQKFHAGEFTEETALKDHQGANPAMRLSSQGNYLTVEDIEKATLENIAAKMLMAGCGYIGISPAELRNKVFAATDKSDEDALAEMARTIVFDRYGFKDTNSNGEWKNYLPLSFCAADFMSKALPYVGTDTNYTTEIGKTHYAMMRR